MNRLLLCILFLGLPLGAYASDMSALGVVVSVPLGIVCFIAAYFLAAKTISRKRMPIMVMIQIPNWLMIGHMIRVGENAKFVGDQVILVGIHIVLLLVSFIPIYIYRNRLRRN